MKRLKEIAQGFRGKLFLAGILLAVCALLYALLYWITGIDLYHFTPLYGLKCGFRRLTSLYCPGCGCTRSVLTLCKGKILTSLYYHPLPVYLTGLYGNFALRHLLPNHLKPAKFRIIYVFILVILLLGNWILRNTLLIVGLSTHCFVLQF